MTDHIETLISIIFICGLLGGITNFLLFYNLQLKSTEKWLYFLKSIFLGLCASISVPLFLQIISNNLLEINNSDIFPEKNYFILAGFCIIASFYSKRFLDDLYSKVTKAEKTAEEAKVNSVQAKEIAEKTLENNQETEDVEYILEKDLNINSKYKFEEFAKVINAILDSKYTYRTISGISKVTEFEKDKVIELLDYLQLQGLAEYKLNKAGHKLWRIVNNNI